MLLAFMKEFATLISRFYFSVCFILFDENSTTNSSSIFHILNMAKIGYSSPVISYTHTDHRKRMKRHWGLSTIITKMWGNITSTDIYNSRDIDIYTKYMTLNDSSYKFFVTLMLVFLPDLHFFKWKPWLEFSSRANTIWKNTNAENNNFLYDNAIQWKGT